MCPRSREKTKILSLSLEECLAKIARNKVGEIGPGCTVEAHSAAAFEVTRELIENFFSHFRTEALWEKRGLLSPLLHDVGKVSPLISGKDSPRV